MTVTCRRCQREESEVTRAQAEVGRFARILSRKRGGPTPADLEKLAALKADVEDRKGWTHDCD